METDNAAPELPRLTGVLEPRSRWSATACSLAKAIDVVSTRSAFLLLREAFYGTTRFDDFAARAGLSEPVTAARLRELGAHGLLARAGAAARPGRPRRARPRGLPRARPAHAPELPADRQGRRPLPGAGRADAV